MLSTSKVTRYLISIGGEKNRKWVVTVSLMDIGETRREKNPVATAPGSDMNDGTITDGGELTHSYAVESETRVKMSKHEIIVGVRRAGFDPVERDTVYNRVEKAAV